MPLKPEARPLWHWTTAVAWIAFDIKDAPSGNIGTWGYSFNDAKARDDAAKGLRQLLEAVYSENIKPIWDKARLPTSRDRAYCESKLLPANQASTEQAMLKSLYGVLNLAGPHATMALYFEREAVLGGWQETSEADNPIHWTQLVARLAFDDIEAERDDIFSMDYWQRYTWDSLQASRRFTRAIHEMCEHAREGNLKPLWASRGRGLMELAGFNHAKAFGENIEQTKSELYGCIYSGGEKSVSYLRREYNRLSFIARECEALQRVAVEPDQIETTASQPNNPGAIEGEEARKDGNSNGGGKKQGRKPWETFMIDILRELDDDTLQKIADSNHTFRCRWMKQQIVKKSQSTTVPKRQTMYPKLDIAILDEQGRRPVGGDDC